MFDWPGNVLKLKKSVYGLRQAPANFFSTLRDGLIARSFEQIKMIDLCLFWSQDVIYVTYVDDCLFFFSHSEEKIDAVLEDLKSANPTSFQLNIEDDVAGFLGIHLAKQGDGSIELKQTGLIDWILHVVNMEDCCEVTMPVEKGTIGKDDQGQDCQETWSYSSIVGMLMYLASNSWPDIAFALHQCARFTHCPKWTHEVAVKQIARYLKGTTEKGVKIVLTNDLKLDLWVDADFAGLWNAEDAQDPASVWCRSGFVATLGDMGIKTHDRNHVEHNWSGILQCMHGVETVYSFVANGKRSFGTFWTNEIGWEFGFDCLGR
jgi:Reverse transcriptase (RNA-dependent DNA polymerase)